MPLNFLDYIYKYGKPFRNIFLFENYLIFRFFLLYHESHFLISFLSGEIIILGNNFLSMKISLVRIIFCEMYDMHNYIFWGCTMDFCRQIINIHNVDKPRIS